MRDTHYIPEFKEFHPEFECERYWRGTTTIIKGQKVYDDTKETTGWQKSTVRETAVEDWDYIDFDDIIIDIKDKDVRVKYLDRKDIEGEHWVFDEKYSAITEAHESMVFSKKINHRGEPKTAMIIYNPTSNWLLISITGEKGATYLLEKGFEEPSIPVISIQTQGTVFAGTIKNKSEFKRILQQTRMVK